MMYFRYLFISGIDRKRSAISISFEQTFSNIRDYISVVINIYNASHYGITVVRNSWGELFEFL